MIEEKSRHEEKLAKLKLVFGAVALGGAVAVTSTILNGPGGAVVGAKVFGAATKFMTDRHFS